MKAFLRTRYAILLTLFTALPAIVLILMGARLLGGLLLLLALVGGPALARRLTGPQERLMAHLNRLSTGEHQQKLLLTDDLVWMQVSAQINGLSDRLEQVTATLEQQVSERTEALERKANQLRAVGEVGRQVAGVLETDHLLHFVASVVRGTFGYDVVAVLLRRGANSEDDAILAPQAFAPRRGATDDGPADVAPRGAHLEVAACAVRGETGVGVGMQIPLASATPASWAVTRGEAAGGGITPLIPAMTAQSELAVPIALAGQILGALVAQSRRPDAFDREDRFTLQTVAGQLAVALENGRLLAAERQLRDLAISEERNRMAREIHDTLAQGFMGILMQARAASQIAEGQEELQFHLDQIQALASQNLQEARRSVWNLRPQPLEGRTLGEALAEEVANAGQRAALDARFAQAGAPIPLPANVEITLLRAVQEALNNAIKYSSATELTVTLTYEPVAITLTVADNGKGFDPAALPATTPGSGGFGLQAMADRARTLGGTITLTTAPGQGTAIQLQIPIREEARL